MPNLYRYTSNGVYYGLVRHRGKLHKKSLETTDKTTAKRLLADFQRDLGKVDASQGKLTLEQLCTRYLLTIASLAKKSVQYKKATIAALLADFMPGPDVQVNKVKPSDLQGWVSSYKFGYASYNHYIQVLKDLFAIAIHDKVIVSSPVAELKHKKTIAPIRLTPTFEDFNAIVTNVRSLKMNGASEESADFIQFMGLLGVGQAGGRWHSSATHQSFH